MHNPIFTREFTGIARARKTSFIIGLYLLMLAGLLLIVVAAANETLKQKGDSLKTKAGRLWDDWQW